MPERKVYFNSVFIIETLKPNEYHTGRRIFEGVESFAAVATPPVSIHFKLVETKDQFLDVLHDLACEAQAGSIVPLLHIEAHGSPQGTEVTSGEFIQWMELKNELTVINAATGLNLVVIVSACDGAHLLSIVQPTDRSPVYGLIGPNRIVTAGEVERAGLAFYRTLFEVRDAIAAWQAMNRTIDPSAITFSLFPAEYWFREAVRGYLRTLCTEEALVERENRAVANALRNGLAPERVLQFRQDFGAYIRDHRRYFDEIKRDFFFCDLYPENATRFKIRFEDCLEQSGASPSNN